MLLPGFETPILRDPLDDLINSVGGAGTTYGPSQIDRDGSITGRAGTSYQVGSNGSVRILTTAPAPSTSVTVQNTPVQNQGGRFDTRVDDSGRITGIPGAVYQIDTYDGSIQIISKPTASQANPADKNNDGLDDSTNMALGVFPDRTGKSPTGYVYGNGQAVWPNGAPYEGSDGGAPDLVNGKYIWDGSKFVVAPGLETPASSSSFSSSFTPSRPSSSSSSGGSSASSRDYIGEINARTDSEIQIAERRAELEREFFYAKLAAENDPNNLQNQIKLQQLAESMRQFNVEQQGRDIDSFRSAVSDVDPAAFRAWQFANGLEAGGNIANRLSEGGNALSDNANAGAAALLARIRNPQQNQWAQMAGLPSPSVPGAQGTGGAPGGIAPPPQASTPVAPGAPATGLPNPEIARNENARIAQAQADERAKAQSDAAAYDAAWKQTADGNWVNTFNMDNGVRSGSGGRDKLLAPEYLSNEAYQAQRASLMQDANWQNDYWKGAIIDSNRGGLGSGEYPSYIANKANFNQMAEQNAALGQKMGIGYQTIDPNGQNYAIPSWDVNAIAARDRIAAGGSAGSMPHVIPYGDDNIQRPLPTQITIPGLANGGMARGTFVVGEEGPEVVHAPAGAAVQPISRPVMRGLLRGGMDGYAKGTLGSVTNPYPPGYQAPAPPIQGLTPRPAPQPQPTYQAPSATPLPQATPSQVPVTQQTTTNPNPMPTSTNGVANTPQFGTTQPQTVDSIVNTPTGAVTTDPATAQQIAEIDAWRQAQLDAQFADTGPYSLSFADKGPSFQEGYFKNYQTAKGIPAQDFAAEVNKWRLRGLSRESMLAGTGR